MNLTTSRGAAMAVSLVLLTSVTLLALVALQRSTLQTKMVTNFHIKQAAFDIAFSEVESHFQNAVTVAITNQMLLNALNSVELSGGVAVRDENGQPISLPLSIDPLSNYGHPKIEVITALQFTGSPSNLNWSLAGDSSIGQFSEYKFKVSSKATAPSGISSSQELGFRYERQGG